ncbi:zf-HC2 domain-containing protein [Streptomyces labedae]|uniref:Putative zinc-finger domain-containing protein n=1 Tax=Streptomyces labedae TaxID=285569 RepID=A0ABP6QQS8_9ACTN
MPNRAAGCEEIREWLGAYVVGALEPEEELPIRAHLARCPACRSERDDLADVVKLLRSALPMPAAAHSPRPPHCPPTSRAIRPWRLRHPPVIRAHATGRQTPPREEAP